MRPAQYINLIIALSQHLAQHLLGVLAQAGRGGLNSRRGFAQLCHWPQQAHAIHLLHHLSCQHLWVVQSRRNVVDRAARDVVRNHQRVPVCRAARPKNVLQLLD